MELETNLFDSLRKTLTGSPKDWSLLSEDVWLWELLLVGMSLVIKSLRRTFLGGLKRILSGLKICTHSL